MEKKSKEGKNLTLMCFVGEIKGLEMGESTREERLTTCILHNLNISPKSIK
jgi:hypothetical protein